MKKLIFILLTACLLSCKSTDVKISGISNSLLGVVYDYKSNPIQGATLTFICDIDETFVLNVTTDIDGKFFIPELDFGLYSVSVKAKGCAPSETVVDHFDIENVLILRVSSFDDLTALFKEGINNKDLEKAEKNRSLLEEIDNKDPYYRFLKSIYFIETEEYKKSEEMLLGLLSNTENYPYVNLLLADLYQYYLEDRNSAIKYLNRFLQQEYRENESIRVKELESVL